MNRLFLTKQQPDKVDSSCADKAGCTACAIGLQKGTGIRMRVGIRRYTGLHWDRIHGQVSNIQPGQHLNGDTSDQGRTSGATQDCAMELPQLSKPKRGLHSDCVPWEAPRNKLDLVKRILQLLYLLRRAPVSNHVTAKEVDDALSRR